MQQAFLVRGWRPRETSLAIALASDAQSLKRSLKKLLDARRRAQKAAGSSSALEDIRDNCNEV